MGKRTRGRPGRLRRILLALAAAAVAGLAQAPSRAQVDTKAAAPPAPPAQVGQEVLSAVADLPSGRIGRPYDTTVVRGGGSDYVWDEQVGVPDGLTLTSDGRLVGKPTLARLYHLHLAAHDRLNPAKRARSELDLRVWPLPTHKPKVEPAKLAPEYEPPEGDGPGEMTVYCLSVADLVVLAGEEPAVAPAPVATAPHPGCPGRVRPGDIIAPPVAAGDELGPIVDMTFPTRALFEAAVVHRLADRDDIGPAERSAIRLRAARVVSFNEAAPLRWSAAPACDCTPPLKARNYRRVYGFFPFWQSGAPSPPIDFALFDRIGLLGVQLTNIGDWRRPVSATGAWWTQTSEFARAAHAHGAHLDLVLMRSNWSWLRPQTPSQITSLAIYSAKSALETLDTPMTDRGALWRGLLWSFWQSPRHVFDGATVMFTPPEGDAATVAAYESFVDQFMVRLIEGMQTRRRPFALNIVVSDETLCKRVVDAAPAESGKAVKDGPDSDGCAARGAALDRLMYYKHLAEPRDQTPPVGDDDASSYTGTTKITVRFLPMMSDPTGDSKKAMRRRIDDLENGQAEHAYEGHARVTLQQAIIPIVITLAKLPQSPDSAVKAEDETRLEKDIPYFNQNFGGVGFWMVPVSSDPAGARVNRVVAGEFFPNLAAKYQASEPKRPLNPFAYPTCSTALRLIWQLSVLLIPIGLLLYAVGDASLFLRRIYAIATVAVVVAMCLLGFYLLETDPVLDDIKTGNLPLWVVLGLSVAVGAWFSFRAHVKDP